MKTNLPYTEVKKTAPEPEFQLTVITVCRNALADLKPTVESVQRQKAKGSISIEHVVVDGASTDGTPEWLAQQLAAGNIERYVSEPDRGIFDAMNKGINLARGRVLAFLNAGDGYAGDVDLAECVLPICKGETESVAAVAEFMGSRTFPYHRPDYRQHLFHAPCCHQAFFASAVAYRSIGGYDAPHFKCSGDGDMMCKMYYKYGQPAISGLVVVHYDTNGLSSNFRINYLDERVEILWRHWEKVKGACVQDPEYMSMVQARLCQRCAEFSGWQEARGRAIPETLEKLRQMCREAAEMAGVSPKGLALRFLAHSYLPRLVRGEAPPRGTRQCLTLCQCLCRPRPENKYTEGDGVPGGSLSMCVRGKARGWLQHMMAGGRREDS